MTSRRCRVFTLVATLASPGMLAGQEPGAAAGIDAARRGGVVIVCRHGITGRFNEDEMTLRYDDPSTQRQLTRRGERQADAMARAFRALEVRVAEVIASPMQRARRTAEPFGPVVLDSSWHTRGNDYTGPKRDARLAMLGRPVPSGNRLIVSHIGTMQSVIPSIGDGVDEGDCVVLHPVEGNRFEYIGVVPWRAWLRAAGIADGTT